jgi:hypothetical protein
MPPLVNRCPTVGKQVQVWYESGEDPAEVADAFLESSFVRCADRSTW